MPKIAEEKLYVCHGYLNLKIYRVSDLISPSCSLRVTLRSIVGGVLVFTLAFPVSVQHMILMPMQIAVMIKSQTASPSNKLPPSSNCVCHHAPQNKMQNNVNTETMMLTMISDNILL